MKYFFPDSQDFVDPSFDFRTEARSRTRVRQRDDLYPHEVFSDPPYDGILVSKSIVDRGGNGTAKYTIAQRQRLLRDGVRRFFRLEDLDRRIETMGDCGAFSYIREEEPVWSVDEVIEFYEICGFDYGISVDHVIPVFQPELDETMSIPGLSVEDNRWQRRQETTLEYAHEFFEKADSCGFKPVGVAQGWSPKSYVRAVRDLQDIGFRLIALGGLVPLKTPEIMDVLEAVSEVKHPDAEFHLLGVTRLERMSDFETYGVTSFDSTSPLKQAFKDATDNYHALDGSTYPAIRIPQVEANLSLKRRIGAGEVDGREARDLERKCLDRMEAFDRGQADVNEVVRVLTRYEELHRKNGKTREEQYRRVLDAAPWRDCDCEVCRDLGIHVILFRGAERNRRRGFHNVWVAYRRLQCEELVGG